MNGPMRRCCLFSLVNSKFREYIMYRNTLTVYGALLPLRKQVYNCLFTLLLKLITGQPMRYQLPVVCVCVFCCCCIPYSQTMIKGATGHENCRPVVTDSGDTELLSDKHSRTGLQTRMDQSHFSGGKLRCHRAMCLYR